MLHARFLPEKDFEKAEEYLERGIRYLDQAHKMPERDRHFLRVFLLNGVAFVRHRQGRPLEAIELCKSGSEHLDRHLNPDQHRLHRSVLLYNTAQVYAALQMHEHAIENFSAAMSMDPNYSEYYNERGNVYLSMGAYKEAVQDYLAAIDLSAPYQEVWTNLGQCYRQMGRLEEAIQAYSRALDLDPGALLRESAGLRYWMRWGILQRLCKTTRSPWRLTRGSHWCWQIERQSVTTKVILMVLWRILTPQSRFLPNF